MHNSNYTLIYAVVITFFVLFYKTKFHIYHSVHTIWMSTALIYKTEEKKMTMFKTYLKF